MRDACLVGMFAKEKANGLWHHMAWILKRLVCFFRAKSYKKVGMGEHCFDIFLIFAAQTVY